MEGVLRAWGRILAGYRPNLSIEITRECPLHCPGCYAYGDQHLGGGTTLREVRDLKGQALIDGVIGLVDRLKPLHLSIVGGEPLVRRRELEMLLPMLAERGVYTQLVTSAVAPIPSAWAGLPRLQICVSIDGLPAEHDVRRAPATYARILKNIAGHQHHGALHRHPSAGVSATATSRSSWPRGRPTTTSHDLGQPLHTAGRRGVGRVPDRGGPGPHRPHSARAAAALSEAADAQGADRRPGAIRRRRPRPASSRRRPSASRPTWRSASRHASSAARLIVRAVVAWPRRPSPRSAVTACPAACASSRSSTPPSPSGSRCEMRRSHRTACTSRASVLSHRTA